MASWIRKEDPEPYETVELIISGIIPIGLIVIGTIGNLTSISILLRKDNRRTSTNIYLIFLCLMDTISLYQWNLSTAIFTFTKGKQQIWGKSLIMCKLSQFFPFYTLHTSAMFLTFVELDRACLLRSVWYKRKIARPCVALALCIVILIVLFALNGFLFALGFQYEIYDSSTGEQQTQLACFYTLDANLMNYFSHQYPWVRYSCQSCTAIHRNNYVLFLCNTSPGSSCCHVFLSIYGYHSLHIIYYYKAYRLANIRQ
jgi:hypothetical protein